MEHRRRWLSLCPVVPLCGATDYDEVSKKIFAANPTISGDVLHAFLLRGYGVNVAASELEQWIYEARLHYARPLFGYDDLLRGCYNVQPTMDASFFCGVLADSGVDCTIASMECWMLLQTPLVDVKLTDYNTFIAGCEIVAFAVRICSRRILSVNRLARKISLMCVCVSPMPSGRRAFGRWSYRLESCSWCRIGYGLLWLFLVCCGAFLFLYMGICISK